TRWFRRLWTATGLAGLARRLLPGYLALLLIVQLMPFDFTIGPEELALKYEEGKVWLLPFHYGQTVGAIGLLGKALANMACFFPLGFLRALAAERGSPAQQGWWPVLRFGLTVSSLVELLQLFVYSRFCDTT